MTDRLLRFDVSGSPVRGEWIELDSAWREIVTRHSQESEAIAVLGELTAASMLLSATLKHRGRLTAQITGDGPISLMVVDCHAGGTFRATLKRSAQAAAQAGGASDAIGLLNPNGGARFAITIDPREEGTTAYQGIVPLEGTSIATMLEHYMDRSEQLPTRLWLAADEQRAVGLLLQKIPQPAGSALPDVDAWGRLQKIADTLSSAEMLGTDGDTLMHRLFWQERTAMTQTHTLSFACSCSRKRVADMLRMLGANDLRNLLAEQGLVSVNCDYCNTPYGFDAVDVQALFEADALPPNPTRQ